MKIHYTSAWILGLCWTYFAGAASQEWRVAATPPSSPTGIVTSEDPWALFTGPSVSAVEAWLDQGGNPNQLVSYPSPFAVLPEDITLVSPNTMPTITTPVWQAAALEGNWQVIDLLLNRECSLVIASHIPCKSIIEILAADVQTSAFLQQGVKNLHALLGSKENEIWDLIEAEGEMEPWMSAARQWLFGKGATQQFIALKLWGRTDLWIV